MSGPGAAQRPMKARPFVASTAARGRAVGLPAVTHTSVPPSASTTDDPTNACAQGSALGTARDVEAGVWIVVPAYNEGAVVGRTVRDLRSRFSHVVVVDDGSRDDTADEALLAGGAVLRHVLNLGQGASLQTGIEYALSRGAEYVATFDADGQHHVEDLERMLDVLRAERLDVVLGSRFLGRAEGMSAARRLLLRGAVVLTRLTTGVRLTDAHNGLRIMTAETARRLHLLQDDMAHASEFVSQIGSLGCRVAEVPVTITYTAYSREKGQRMSNSFRILADLVVGWLLR